MQKTSNTGSERSLAHPRPRPTLFRSIIKWLTPLKGPWGRCNPALHTMMCAGMEPHNQWEVHTCTYVSVCEWNYSTSCVIKLDFIYAWNEISLFLLHVWLLTITFYKGFFQISKGLFQKYPSWFGRLTWVCREAYFVPKKMLVLSHFFLLICSICKKNPQNIK